MLLFQPLPSFLIRHQVSGEDASANVCDRVCDQMLSMLSLYWHWGELVWLADRSSLSVEKSMELMRIRSSDDGEDAAQVTMLTTDKGHPAGISSSSRERSSAVKPKRKRDDVTHA